MLYFHVHSIPGVSWLKVESCRWRWKPGYSYNRILWGQVYSDFFVLAVWISQVIIPCLTILGPNHIILGHTRSQHIICCRLSLIKPEFPSPSPVSKKPSDSNISLSLSIFHPFHMVLCIQLQHHLQYLCCKIHFHVNDPNFKGPGWNGLTLFSNV